MKKIAYIYPEILPSKKARSVSVVNTACELSKITDTTLFFEKNRQKNIFEFYNLNCNNLNLQPISKKLIIRSNKIFNRNLLVKVKKENYIFYVRHLKTAKFLIQNGFSIVFEYHEIFTQTNPALKQLENFVITNSSGLVFTNKSLIEEASKLFDISNIPKKVIYNGCGFDLNYIEKDFSKIDEIYYIGSFQPWKGVEFLVENMRFFPNLTLKIVGDGDKTKLLNIIKKFQLKNIKFMGFKNHQEIKDILKKSKITIIPNIPTTFSNVSSPIKLYEYLMSSNIVLSADMKTVKEIIKDKENGFMFASGNIQDFKDKLETIINQPSDKLLQISQKAYKTGMKFTWKNRAKNIFLFMKELYEKDNFPSS